MINIISLHILGQNNILTAVHFIPDTHAAMSLGAGDTLDPTLSR